MTVKLRKWSVVLLVMLAMVLAACGGDDGDAGSDAGAGSDDPAEAVATEGSDAAEDEPGEDDGTGDTGATGDDGDAGMAMGLPAECTGTVDLQYWTPFTGPDGPFMQTLVDQFNGENPNILVTMTTQSEYNTQLATAAASDTLPDVAIINEDQIATQAFRNVLRPMGDVVEAAGIDGSDFPAVAWDTGEVAGERYGVPLSFVAMTMFYNQDLLEAAGLDGPPTNGEEFEAAAEAMTADGNNGFLLTTGFPVQQVFQQLLHQYGGSEFSEDGTEATWNSEAGVQALEWMVDAQTRFGQPNLEVDAELNAFKGGTVGMIWNGIWQIPNVTGEGVEFNGQATATPQIGPEPAVWAGGPFLTLPARQSGTDACKDAAAGMFIKYLLDNSLEWARAGNIPASNTVRESAGFLELSQASIAPSVQNPVFPPPVPGIGDAFGPLGEAVSAVMAGTETDIQAALDAAAERSNQILEENRANYGDAPSAP